jgi:hydrogenase nickel incorporation protein HypA/HybF
MHELSIAESILTAVRTELKSLPGAKPLRIGVKLGILAAVDVEALRFCFDIAVAGTDLEGLKLDARVIPGECMCLSCGHRMISDSTVRDCERCQSSHTILSGSDEMELDGLEVDYDEHNRRDFPEAKSVERESANCREPARAL